MNKLNVISCLFILSFSLTLTAQANRCYSLFSQVRPYKYQAKVYEIEELYKNYPLFRETINKLVTGISGISISKTNVTAIEQISEQGSLRSFTANDTNDPAKLQNLDPELKQQIINSYNHLLNREAFAKYLKELVLDTAVYMMKHKEQQTDKLTDMNNPVSAKTGEKTTREEFLKLGKIDHNSLARILVDRIISRGDRITVIPKNGNFNNNKTKMMKFSSFYLVPRNGPFFDKVFTAGSAHGQETHLLQMDYVESVLTNREQFWNYTTKQGRGDWVWDTLFDGTNGTIMHPEYIGPLIRAHLPLY